MPAGFRLQTRASPGRGQAGKAPGLVLTHILQVKQNLQRQHRARQQRRDWRQDRAPPSAPRGRPSLLRLRPSCFRFIRPRSRLAASLSSRCLLAGLGSWPRSPGSEYRLRRTPRLRLALSIRHAAAGVTVRRTRI